MSSFMASARKAAPPNAERIQEPMDMAERHLKTRNMLRKRSGRPRSEISSAGHRPAPINGIQRTTRIMPGIRVKKVADEGDQGGHAGDAADEKIEGDFPGPGGRLQDWQVVIIFGARNRCVCVRVSLACAGDDFAC